MSTKLLAKGQTKLTLNMVRDEINASGDILLSTTYTGVADKLRIQCSTCETVYLKQLHHFRRGQKCIKCVTDKGKYHTVHGYEHVKSYIRGQGDTLLDDAYVNETVKMRIQCGVCKKIELRNFNKYKQGRRCTGCRDKKLSEMFRHNIEYIREFVKAKGDRFVGAEYINSRTHIPIECGTCKNVFPVTFGNYSKGHGCPTCAQSKGEKKIAAFLDRNQIEYIQQHIFPDCVHKAPLRFDFYIPYFDYCIEYDGEQHDRAVDFFGGEEAFENLQIRDGIKNDYCKAKKKKLIRIKHHQFDQIDEIMTAALGL